MDKSLSLHRVSSGTSIYADGRCLKSVEFTEKRKSRNVRSKCINIAVQHLKWSWNLLYISKADSRN